MPSYRLSGLADDALLREGAASARNESASTALLLAHIAEIEARRLHATEGYDSMCAFCVGEWGLCEYAAYRRIGAARAARDFPAIFAAVADGRLTLTAVNLLAPALTPENAGELLAAAGHRTKRQVQDLLAERSVTAEAPARKAVAPAAASDDELAPALVVPEGASKGPRSEEPPATASPTSSAAPRFPLQAVLGPQEQDDLDYLKALLGHAVPSGELRQVLGRVFQAAIRELERRKFAVTSRSRTGAQRGKAGSRQVPRAVRRGVFERDHGHCTFVSAKGHRCESRTRLEFDHIRPVARGGQSTVANVRLRCHTHNRLEAERTFGAGFMECKREESRRRAEARKTAAKAKVAERVRKEARARELAANAEARERAMEVIPWLRGLGVSEREARRAAARCAAMPDASLEDRVRHALKGLAPAGTRRVAPVASASA